jgi:4-hydroxybenzoate polyprenyltransferase
MPPLRTWLTLVRPGNLPTVWSNCLAGWWLGGGGELRPLPLLLGGVTLLYIGGAFLNDAFDADFDRAHRRTLPIPSGEIGQSAVLTLGALWLLLGCVCLFWLSRVSGGLALFLAGVILVFDAVHRLVTFSPFLLGLSRFLVYLIGASVAGEGITGWSLWCGLAMAAYVAGAGSISNWRRALLHWPLVLLCSPVLLAFFMNGGEYREGSLLLSAVLLLWLLRALRQLLWSGVSNPIPIRDSLVAGIVLVDWLAVADAPRNLSFVLITLFLLALVLQRVAPRHLARSAGGSL